MDRHREQDEKVNPDQKILNRFTSTGWQDLVGSYGPYDMRYLEASEWKSRCIAYLNSFSECQYFYEHPDRLKNLPITGASFLRLMSAERVIRLLLIQYAMLAKWAEEEHRASSSPVTSLSPPDAGSVNAHAGVMVSVAESASSIPAPAASSGEGPQGPTEAPAKLLKAAPVKLAKDYPKRAAWLRDLLHARGLSKYGLEELDGPNHETTAKILAGLPVQHRVIEKLAEALQIPIAQIPDE